MFDIHCHIIPGVDDGSFDIEDSVKMAKLAAAGGTKIIVATPHSNSDAYQNYWGPDLKNRFLDLQTRIEAEHIPLKICLGQEILADGNFIDLLKSGQLLTVNNSGYPLVEFDFHEPFDQALSKLSSLIAEGFTPIVAHPERYSFISEDFDTAHRLKKMGCLFQLNKGSIKGYFGAAIRQTAHDFLKSRLADFVASDAHGPFVRTPYLADVHEIISEKYSEDYANLLLIENPSTALKGQDL